MNQYYKYYMENFKIKEGDLIQVRDHHETDSDEWGRVSLAYTGTFPSFKKMFYYHDPQDAYALIGHASLDQVFRVRREQKGSTVGATFPCNWVNDDLIPFRFTPRTLRVYDLKLKLKTYTFPDVDRIVGKSETIFKAYSSDGLNHYDEHPMVSGTINNETGFTEAWNGAYADWDNALYTRCAGHWADAVVRVIANIY